MSDYISSRVKQLRQEREVAKKQSSSASSKSQKSESYVAKRVSEIRAGRENPVKGAGTLAQESEDRVSAANKTSPGGLLPSLLNMLQRSTELQNQTTYRNREIMNEADAGLGQAFANLITPDDPVKALTKAEQSTGLRTVPTAQREQIVQSTLNRDGATDQEIEEAKSRTPEALYNEYNTWLEQGDNRDILSSLINAEQAARRVPSDQVDQYIMDTLLDQGYTVDRVREVQNRRSEYEKSVPFGYDITHRIGSSIEGIGSDAVGSALMALPVFSQALDDILFTGQKTSPDDIDGLAGQIYQLGKSIYGSGQENLQESRLGLNDLQELAYGAAESAGENIALGLLSPGLALGEQTARAAGAGISDMADAGRSSGAAALSALGHGAISYGIEQLGIGQMMRNMGMRTGMSPLVDSALDKIASLPGLNRLPGAIAGIAANAGEEGAEEFVQSYADTALDNLLGAPNAPNLLSSELLNEALQSAAGGAAGGALIGGISSAIGQARTSQRFQPRADEVANNQLTAAIQQAGQAGQMQQAAAMEMIQNPPETNPVLDLAHGMETSQTAEAARPKRNEADASDVLSMIDAVMAENQKERSSLPTTENVLAMIDRLLYQNQTPEQTVQKPAGIAEDSPQPKIVDNMLDELTAQSGGRLDASAWGMLASQPQQTAQQESQPAPRELYQTALEENWDDVQHQEARLMAENTTMSEAAVNTAVEAMPADVSGEVYALASNSMYQLARQGLTESADEALDLAARSGVRVNQILAAPGGAEALRQVFNQGLIEGLQEGGYGRAGLADASRAGAAEYADGTLIPDEDRALIDLFAAASDTAVTVSQKLEKDAGGYVDTALGKVYFGAEAGADTFGTILHESNHWYNAWDEAGGRELQTELLKYQAQQMGFENVDALAQQYIEEYQAAGEPLTYAQACEEITSDALRGIFDSEESFARWVNHQQSLAQQNAGQRGTIQKIVDAMRDLLDKVISKAKSILSRSPDNAAAKHAQSLAESQKRALEELYYKHAETAMEAERRARAANENAESKNRNAEFENENAESANGFSNSDNNIEKSTEEIENEPAKQTAERMKEDARRYQLPVDQAQMESGQRAAAWENVDRAGMEQALEEAFSLAETERVPVENIRRMTKRILKEEQSRADESVVVKQLHNLIRYMTSGKADFKMAFENAIGIADVILQRSGKKDSSLWNKYEDLHYFKFKIEKNGVEHQKLVQDYGTYELAKRELARFGITVTTSEKSEAQSINQDYKELSEKYPELFSSDITDSIDQLYKIASVRQAIKPSTQNVYGEDYEEAKADLALRIIGGLVQEGVADKGVAGMLRQRINQNLNIHRTAIQKRVLKVLNAQERRARNEAFEQSQRIVRASGEANLKRAKAWAETSNKMREALAKSENTVQRARDARSADNVRRAIAANKKTLKRMVFHPNSQNHVSKKLLPDAVRMIEMLNSVTGSADNLDKAEALLAQMNRDAKADNGADGIATDWENSGIFAMMDGLLGDMRKRQARIDARTQGYADRLEKSQADWYDANTEFESLYDEYQESPRQESQQVRRMTSMTLDELVELRDISSALITLVRNQNKLLAVQTQQAASEIGAQAKQEVEENPFKLKDDSGKLAEWKKKWDANVFNAERMFEELGGYRHEGGAMEAIGKALTRGEARQNEIKQKGLQMLSNVLEGKENRKRLRDFSGVDAPLHDFGLRFEDTGEAAKINLAQAASLYKHLQNMQNMYHIMEEGVVIPNMKDYANGNMNRAFRLKRLAKINKPSETIQKLQEVLSKDEYFKNWIDDSGQILNIYNKGVINDVSVQMYGYEKAKVDDYFPIVTDPDVLEHQNTGTIHNGTIEGRGFLKERKNRSSTPILLEEIDRVVMRSLSDTAAYGGLAMPIRDANKILNANRNESGSLMTAIKHNFGEDAASFIDDYLTDLQGQPRERKSMFDFLDGLRGNYARAALTLNLSTVAGQVSGVPAMASELGYGPMTRAWKEMGRILADKKLREKLRKEMTSHGYWQLEVTLSDGATAELAELRKKRGAMSWVAEHTPGVNALEWMDEATRLVGWLGAKDYVDHNLTEYGLTEADIQGEERSDAWWNAVVSKMTEVNDRTQPNYTVSQMAAIQRNPNQMAKILTMFRSQTFQNYGIVASAANDVRAQMAYIEDYTQKLKDTNLSPEEQKQLKSDLERVQKNKDAAFVRLRRAVSSQSLSALVFIIAGILVKDLAFHKYDREKDEEGEITPQSVASYTFMQWLTNMVENIPFADVAVNIATNVTSGGQNDPISLSGIDSIGDASLDVYRLITAIQNEDRVSDDESERESYWQNFYKKAWDASGSLLVLAGIPWGQIQRILEAGHGWWNDLATAKNSDGLNLWDVMNAPTSSTVQYDNLYTAIFEEPDPDDVASAMEQLRRLDELNPPSKESNAKAGDSKVLSELLKREKEYGGMVQEAAQARLEGNESHQRAVRQKLVNTLADALGINKNTKEGQRRLSTVIDKVDNAITGLVREGLGADSKTGATAYTALLNEIETGGNVREMQNALRRAGIEDSDIKSAVVSAYKDAYIYGDDTTRQRIEERLLKLTDASENPYFEVKKQANGEEKNEFRDWVTDWELQGLNDSVYTDLNEALATEDKAAAQQQINRYMEAGKSASSIRTQITNAYKQEYLKADDGRRREIAQFIMGLHGTKGERFITADTLYNWILDDAKARAAKGK